ncbi:acetolactate synthase small subunit, partial [Methylobacterium sp. J-088]|nr:acetolactate synthase small subunit [Methylobacterium sp. J-088]
MNAMNTNYPDSGRVEPVNRPTQAGIVNDEPGVLARSSCLVSGRGHYNDSLSVAATEGSRRIQRDP